MSGKDAIAFTALFPHDTQLAALERAQRYLRSAFALLAPESALPFSFMIPFCPVADDDGARSESRERAPFAVGPATADSGWIVAPVSGPRGSGGETADLTDKRRGRLPAIPGYPELPRSEGFILGYAGPLAESVLAGAAARERDEARANGPGVLAGELSVRARYRARVELSIARDGRAYSVAYSIGPASWER